MSVTFNQNLSVNSDGTDPVSGIAQDVGTNNLKINKSFAAGSTNAVSGIVFNGTALKAIILKSTQDCTLKVNSSVSPSVTINLIANQPLVWSASSAYFANPINFNVTEIYVTCTPATTLTGKVLT
jgi:hypothetical protein